MVGTVKACFLTLVIRAINNGLLLGINLILEIFKAFDINIRKKLCLNLIIWAVNSGIFIIA
jgi:hypothetical protein